MILDQEWTQNILFERIGEDNTKWVRCTGIQIVYINIVFASYIFSDSVVEE